MQWGYNFWNSQNSYIEINPWRINDALGAFPAGDGFVVYPGENGPYDSIRIELLSDGWQDYRIALLAEKYSNKATIQKLLQVSGMKDFDVYSHSPKKYLSLRKKLIKIIADKL